MSAVRRVLVEVCLVAVVYVLWQVALVTVSGHQGLAVAVAHGRSLWSVERLLRLPSEAAVQGLVLRYGWVLRCSDWFYSWAHPLALLGTMLWLAIARREAYRRWRSVALLVTLACFAVECWAVAPPRLLGVGVVDVAMREHQSEFTRSTVAQFTAMPSLHVAWAVLDAWAWSSWSRRARWAWVFPVLTVLVVVITGNHTWLECAAGCAVACAVALAASRRWDTSVSVAERCRVGVAEDLAARLDECAWCSWPLSRSEVLPSGQLLWACDVCSADGIGGTLVG